MHAGPPQPLSSEAPQPPQRDVRHGLLPGPLVLAAVAVAVAVVMAAGWIALRTSTAVMDDQPPLSWAERDDWPHRPVRETTLSASGVGYMLTGHEWRELSLHVPAPEADAVRELADLAGSDAFTHDATRDRIEAIRREHEGHFYATHLLATWHRVHGDTDRADALYEQAFAAAPRAVQQMYVTREYQPLPGLAVGRLEVICYRADGGHVDDELRLVYPELVTDASGRVAVPVYATVYAIGTRDEPPTLTAHHREPEVFYFPGRIGTLPVALVEQRP